MLVLSGCLHTLDEDVCVLSHGSGIPRLYYSDYQTFFPSSNKHLYFEDIS